jgi:hypothetical protein
MIRRVRNFLTDYFSAEDCNLCLVLRRNLCMVPCATIIAQMNEQNSEDCSVPPDIELGGKK